MIEYSFTIGSKIDENLTNSWHEWQEHNGEIGDWYKFLEGLPEVVRAQYDTIRKETILLFNDAPARTMFILRWS